MYIATYGDNYGMGKTLSEAIDNLENACCTTFDNECDLNVYELGKEIKVARQFIEVKE